MTPVLPKGVCAFGAQNDRFEGEFLNCVSRNDPLSGLTFVNIMWQSNMNPVSRGRHAG